MNAATMSPTPYTTADPSLRAAALRMADRLAADRFADDRGAPRWAGDRVDAAATGSSSVAVLRHGPVDEGLLTGRAGIALTLAVAATAAGGDPGLARVSWETITDVMRMCPDPSPGALGWQSGDLGVAAAADRIAEAIDDGPLALEAASLAARAVTVLARGERRWLPAYPELLDGLAGHLMAVLSARLPASMSATRRDAAARLVAQISESVVRDERGARWRMAGTMDPVAGMAHGASGITLALAAAASVDIPGTDPALLEDAAMWEAGLFDAEANGWWDLRMDEPVIGMAWCHGAPGIGIAAAARSLLGRTDEVGVYTRACRSAQALAGAVDDDGTLCHGRAGIVELHLAGADAWPMTGEHLRLARASAAPLARGVSDGGGSSWAHGVTGGRSPAVLDGVAGVVLTLLRCDEPTRTPTVAHPGLPR